MVDFMVDLPESEGYIQIMEVVDCFSKMAHFIALKETASTKDIVQVFLKEVWELYGLPKSIVSD
jgi:hypothetical protein